MPRSNRSLASVLREFHDLGVSRVLVKELALNDNSKNQIYIGRGFQTLNLIPVREVSPKEPTTNQKPINFKAKLDWTWLSDGQHVVAPHAQLILYPKYPEVRISGFLRDCPPDSVASSLMNGRAKGRVLFVGIANRTKIYACVGGRKSLLVSDWKTFKRKATDWRVVSKSVRNWSLVGEPLKSGRARFYRLELIDGRLEAGCIRGILEKLQEVHRTGWHDAKRLTPSGTVVPSPGRNSGGNTLEYLFGIASNPSKEPDYRGWELKNLDAQTARLTLMTPEPQDGLYKHRGVAEFVRRFGYPDENNTRRRNFASPHIISKRNTTTKLTLTIEGYSRRTKKITSNDGGIVLKTDRGVIAAKWRFTDLMFDWNRKHSRVVFVPSSSAVFAGRKYNFLQNVAVAEQSDFLLFLEALSDRKVYFDPGTNVVYTRGKPKVHPRSQFRIKLENLDSLYRTFNWVSVCEPIKLRR
jgi:MvaI/BcnI restriction endonuclease family protein